MIEGKRGKAFKVNNRIDFMRDDGEWIEARVKAIQNRILTIEYISKGEKKQAYVSSSNDKISEIGSNSFAKGPNKLQSEKTFTVAVSKPIPKQKEEEFKMKLENSGFLLVEIEGDGNCLFRAVSHQLYATQAFHRQIRRICCDYLSLNRDFFADFIVGDFDEYLERKREEGIWGDHIEIQALAEIYDRKLEIFVYSTVPLKIFNENSGQKESIRLSYHGANHYNSVSLSYSADSKGRNRIAENSVRIVDCDVEKAIEESFLTSKTEEICEQVKVETLKENEEEQLLQMAIKESLNERFSSPAISAAVEAGFPFDMAFKAFTFVGEDYNAIVDFILANLI